MANSKMRYDKATDARRRARKIEVKGTHQRVIQDKRKKPLKHRKPLREE